jgi:hypothetical protein
LRIVGDIGVLTGHIGKNMPLIVEFCVGGGFHSLRFLAVEDHALDAVKRNRRGDIVPRDIECRSVEHEVILEECEFYPDLLLER